MPGAPYRAKPGLPSLPAPAPRQDPVAAIATPRTTCAPVRDPVPAVNASLTDEGSTVSD